MSADLPVRAAPPSVRPDDGRRRLAMVRTPVVWLLVIMLVWGCAASVDLLAPAVVLYPVGAAVAVVVFGVYAVPFLLFITDVDALEPEPRGLLAVAFCWGAGVAMAAAVPGVNATMALLAKATSPSFAADWGPALVAPTIEEPVKLLGVVMIALVAGNQINSIVDGLVYGAVVGLGFQVIEDITYALNAVDASTGHSQVTPVLLTLVARGFVSGLWSHTVFTALAGAGVAYIRLRRRSRRRRVAVAVLCGTGAWLCHFTWNSPTLTDGVSSLVELLVKGVPPLVLVLAVTRTAGRREAVFYVELLERLGDPRMATRDELEALGSREGRLHARAAACRRAGWRPARPWRLPAALRASRAMHQLQCTQARLAVALSRSAAGQPESEQVKQARREVLVARHRLIATGR